MPNFKGQKNFYDYEVTGIVAYNIKGWLEYGLLEKGAYTLVKFDLPTSGYSRLQRTQDERFGGTGRVFEGLGPSWVWENGVQVPSGYTAPFRASGVYVNNTFYLSASTSGQYAHYIDFKTGRVVFDSSIPANDVVKCEYTFRDVDVFLADEYQWRTLQDEYWKRYLSIEADSPSGIASILKDRRVWFPSVGIKVTNTTNDPYQLGGGEIANCEIDYHIFSDKAFSRNRLADIITNEKGTSINLYDINRAPFPYKRNGSLASGATSYASLGSQSSPYFWTKAYIEESDARGEGDEFETYRAQIAQTLSVYRHLSTY